MSRLRGLHSSETAKVSFRTSHTLFLYVAPMLFQYHEFSMKWPVLLLYFEIVHEKIILGFVWERVCQQQKRWFLI